MLPFQKLSAKSIRVLDKLEHFNSTEVLINVTTMSTLITTAYICCNIKQIKHMIVFTYQCFSSVTLLMLTMATTMLTHITAAKVASCKN